MGSPTVLVRVGVAEKRSAMAWWWRGELETTSVPLSLCRCCAHSRTEEARSSSRDLVLGIKATSTSTYRRRRPVLGRCRRERDNVDLAHQIRVGGGEVDLDAPAPSISVGVAMSAEGVGGGGRRRGHMGCRGVGGRWRRMALEGPIWGSSGWGGGYESFEWKKIKFFFF